MEYEPYSARYGMSYLVDYDLRGMAAYGYQILEASTVNTHLFEWVWTVDVFVVSVCR